MLRLRGPCGSTVRSARVPKAADLVATQTWRSPQRRRGPRRSRPVAHYGKTASRMSVVPPMGVSTHRRSFGRRAARCAAPLPLARWRVFLSPMRSRAMGGTLAETRSGISPKHTACGRATGPSAAVEPVRAGGGGGAHGAPVAANRPTRASVRGAGPPASGGSCRPGSCGPACRPNPGRASGRRGARRRPRCEDPSAA